MSEKPESDEFEDEEAEEAVSDEESLDVDRLMQDLDKRKRGAARGAEPAWRKLERLMEQKRTSELLLDFDDSGYGWFLYDLAASLSFIETSPQVPALVRAWLTGYLEVRTLRPEDIRMIDTMILLRRMALLAWIGSHSETALAQLHAERFALDTATMARKYLAR
jgi:hypothetical protein